MKDWNVGDAHGDPIAAAPAAYAEVYAAHRRQPL
jgi:hypothetical protein